VVSAAITVSAGVVALALPARAVGAARTASVMAAAAIRTDVAVLVIVRSSSTGRELRQQSDSDGYTHGCAGVNL
jgi:hypothetical protein